MNTSQNAFDEEGSVAMSDATFQTTPRRRSANSEPQAATKHSLPESEAEEEQEDDEVYDEDDEDEDTPRVPHPKKKKGKQVTIDIINKVLVGHLTKEPVVKVFAKMVGRRGGNGALFQAFKLFDLPNHVREPGRWDELVPKNTKVKAADVTLSSELFGLTEEANDCLSESQKSKLVRDLLQSGKPGLSFDYQSMPIENPRQKGTVANDPTELLVGELKERPVPVYAYLRPQPRTTPYNHPAVVFKMLRKDMKSYNYESHSCTIKNPVIIKFDVAFRAPTIGETQAAILSYFAPKDQEESKSSAIRPCSYRTCKLMLTNQGVAPESPKRSPNKPLRKQSPRVTTDNQASDTIVVLRRDAPAPAPDADGASNLPRSLQLAKKSARASNAQYEAELSSYAVTLSQEKSTQDEERADIQISKDAFEAEEQAVREREIAVQRKEDDVVEREKAVKDVELEQIAFENTLSEREESLAEEALAVKKSLDAVDQAKKQVSKTDHGSKFEQLEIQILMQAQTESELRTENRTALAKVAMLETDNRTAETKIADLEVENDQLMAENDQLRADNAALSSRSAAPPSWRPQPLDLAGQDFDQVFKQVDPKGFLGEGASNATMYHDNSGTSVVRNEAPFNGKRFIQKRVLQAINIIKVDGELREDDLPSKDGLSTYSSYLAGGVEKLVQNLGPASLVQHEDRVFVAWTCFKEEQARFTF